MKGATGLKKHFILLTALCLSLCLALPCFAASFYSSSRYVNDVARYIAGDMARIGRGTFMALNEKEYRRRGGVLLFRGTGMTQEDMLRAYYDPARLQYMAHAVMRVMSNVDKKNYKYYQRRLAEFQAALDSAINVGRYSIPKDAKILDLTYAEGALISCALASSNISRPNQSEWNRWTSGDTGSLVRLIEMNEAQGSIILIDAWTPSEVRQHAAACKNRITMPIAKEADYFNSLNSIYRYVGKRIKDIKNRIDGEKKK